METGTVPRAPSPPEDIEQIAIEGTEYTFPLSYDDIQALGWAVSEEGYRLVTSYDVRYVLPMEHETYPGVYLMLYSEYWAFHTTMPRVWKKR